MGKRKRGLGEHEGTAQERHKHAAPDRKTGVHTASSGPNSPTVIQIVTGSYEKVLHGITATIPQSVNQAEEDHLHVQFADTFLFAAHSSAIRCLALSPQSTATDAPQSQKVILASGSTDERINLYHISASPPSVQKVKRPSIPSLAGNNVTENPKNRELGSLIHHSSSVSALYFPTRSKLLSAAEDNTIAVTRTRDWTVLSTIKAPIPKAIGRPSGDTAPPGGTPAGVNDFAVHPSMKLMISVGKGEKCMRLWNLVTGKKAGVLSFERELLQSAGEGKWSSGEGKKLEWNSKGDEFVVGFEKGAVVFGMDSKPKCRILPSPSTKIHQLHYLAPAENSEETPDLLAISTEDGRILFYSTKIAAPPAQEEQQAKSVIATCEPLGQLGGHASGVANRIKDFEVLRLSAEANSSSSLIIVTGCSDGSIRLWWLNDSELTGNGHKNVESSGKDSGETDGSNNNVIESNGIKSPIRQVSRLLGTYETGNRITCLKAFIMLGVPDGMDDVQQGVPDDEFNGIQENGEDSESS